MMNFRNLFKLDPFEAGRTGSGIVLLKTYIFFLAVSIVAYAGIALLQYSLKWDMLDCYLPWRYFVGESIQNGVFPFWNPYQHLGYPIHADLRSVFYPEAIIVGLFGGYSVYTLHFLFITYISLAGLGMFLLAGHFTQNIYARLLAGIVYMLSGFFVSHGQEMFGIIAATWIPYILYFFIRLQQDLKWDELWKLSFFMFLQLTGGYQALTIMLFYLLLIIFLTRAISLIYHKNYDDFKRLLLMNASLALLVLVSASVLIVTFMQVSPHIGRFGGTSLAEAQFMPFSPRSMISFLLPFASVKDTAYFDTDLSMNNAYVGLVMLMFYLIAWFRKKSALENIFWLFGLVCLFAAFGSHSPVREWLYDYVPMMNLFRMSAFFRYFTVISMVLLGAAEISRMFERPEKYYKRFSIMIALFAVIIAALVLFSRPFVDVETFNPLNFFLNLNQTLETSTRHEHIIVQGLIQLLFLTLLIVALVFTKKKGKGLIALLLVFMALEMTVAVRLNFPVTVGSDPKPMVLQQSLNQLPEGFPLPDLDVPVIVNRDIKPELQPLWRNTNIYTKTVSADGFNSFRLDAFESLQRDYPAMFESVLKNPALFLSGHIKPIAEYNEALVEPGLLWLDETVYENISPQIGSQQRDDKIILKKFDPNHILCEVSIAEAQALTLIQADYPGWRVFINGEPVEHFTANQLFISCLLPEGKSTVEFSYDNKTVKTAFYVSYFVFILIISVILFRVIYEPGNRRRVWCIFITVGTGLLVAVLLVRITSSDQKRLKSFEKIAKHISALNPDPQTTLLVLNVDAPDLMNAFIDSDNYHVLYHRFSRKTDLLHFESKLNRMVSENKIENLVFVSYNLLHGLEVEEIIRKNFPNQVKAPQDGRVQICVFDKQQKRIPLFHSFNDLEQQYPFWTGNLSVRDSAISFSGDYSWRLDAAQPGSPALVASFADLGVEAAIRIVSTAQVNLSAGADAALYLVVECEGKTIWQRTLRCSEMVVSYNQWTKIILAAEPEFQPLPTDILKMFFWINGNAALWVDDVGIEVYPLGK
ncbi:MAG: hypothetical protein IH597_01765 [Bacteroidales bacterium]|nr:hypothetical protein [Bacteroidales bacterium]